MRRVEIAVLVPLRVARPLDLRLDGSMGGPVLAFVEDAVVEFAQDLVPLPAREGLGGSERLGVGQEDVLKGGGQAQRPQAGKRRLAGAKRAADLSGAAAHGEGARQAPAPPEDVISLEKM